ncbi:MAG: FkbM family methyltransferase [Candidatus Aenigmarchaeota archaeon]|nr:FkbM family methyltransferase [Candidatus Aenigmarchaeota archaeon]
MIALIYRKVSRVLSGHGIGNNKMLLAIDTKIKQKILNGKPPEKVSFQGHVLFIGKKDEMGLSVNEFYEGSTTALIRNTLRSGDIAVDIGANIGYFTIIMSELVGEKGKVFAFEPEPENFSLLEKNIQANKYQNIAVAERKAVSDFNGQSVLFLSKRGSGWHTMRGPQNGSSVKIKCTTLDNYFKNFKGEISLIKMDIEGLEPQAVKGMLKMIKNKRIKKMIVEYAPSYYRDPSELLTILKKLGFRMYDIDYNMEEITEFKKVTERHQRHTNVYCIRCK